ncbi:hypothetical protein CORC01_14372 [Colletotrichum orchidophilum]|uniref:Uncharacterized protein n=1 Tax=Colletotrichum orchidophilum TaxID=1209926 RepID=A0A1G4AMM8_9PEZI|nr:uncharacterized protein CORC01_14372 [Colletotrichum orchidophilum]OHE90335.1 hypothetical protein CORC01_14372 [Colletotrichum orchidophilum]
MLDEAAISGSSIPASRPQDNPISSPRPPVAANSTTLQVKWLRGANLEPAGDLGQLAGCRHTENRPLNRRNMMAIVCVRFLGGWNEPAKEGWQPAGDPRITPASSASPPPITDGGPDTTTSSDVQALPPLGH